MEYIRITLTSVLSLLLVTLVYSHTAIAQCDVTGMTPSGGEIVDCTGLEPGGIDTTDFADLVTINEGATVSSTIFLRDGDDTINIFGTTLGPGSLNASDDNDIINVIGGRMFAPGGDCINAARDDDTIVLENALLECSGFSGVNAANGNDIIMASNSEVSSDDRALNAASGDDEITLGDNLLLTVNVGDKNIDCGPDFDTLTFAMTVAEPFATTLAAQIAASDPQDGEVTINGFFFGWERCEELIVDFRAPEPRPIPTLSEWGLIAMVGALGIFGAFYMMRRKQTA